jgi:plasmid stability protein
MPTLYVENVPRDLYEALRKRAKSQHRSMAAEVLALLERNFPTVKELKRRREFVDKLNRLDACIPPLSGDSPSSDEMIREDRSR